MYQVSNAFWKAITENNSIYSISGQIQTDSGAIDLSDNNIIGTLSIDRECVNGEYHQYGCLSASILKISIISDVDRYGFYDKEITLFFTVNTENGEETIPLGRWYITDAFRRDDVIDIEAIDGSLAFKIKVFESTIDYLYELLIFVCHICGIEFGMTKQEVEDLPNGSGYYSIDQDLVKTYTEVIEQAAKLTATIPMMNRLGQLVLVPYSSNARQGIDMDVVINDKVSDYEVFYTGMTVSMVSDNEWVPLSFGDESGLVMELGDISLASGLESTIEEYARNLFDIISQVRYTPVSMDLESNPAYDVGDKIVYQSGETVFIHRMIWKYDEIGTIDCVGQNPKLKKKEDTKLFDNIIESISGKTVAVYKYTNSSAISLKGGGNLPADMKEVIRIQFASTADTTTLFMATIPFNLDIDGTVEFLTYIDAVYYDKSVVKQYCNRGANAITFLNYIDVMKNTRYLLQVYMRTSYEGDSDIRKANANIATNTNAVNATVTAYNDAIAKIMAVQEFPIADLKDISYTVVPIVQTVPTAKIEAGMIKATIFGQGLAGKEKWDGTLAFEEFFGGEIPYKVIPVQDFTVDVAMESDEYEDSQFNEIIGKISYTKIPIVGFTVTNNITTE